MPKRQFTWNCSCSDFPCAISGFTSNDRAPGGPVTFVLMLFDSVWKFYDAIIKTLEPFTVTAWKSYCQHMRPKRLAVKQQIFLPALIVMITLITEGSPSSVTCWLTAISVLYLRLSVRVPSYDVMVDQPYSYWIRVLIPYLLKPVLIIVVLALTPVFSKKRILVTGIILLIVQLFQIPTLCWIIYCYIITPTTAFFVMGIDTSTPIWVLFSVPVFSAVYSHFFPNKLKLPLSVTVICTLVAATLDHRLGFITVSVPIPVWILFSYSVDLLESELLVTILILGLVMNVVLTKFGMLDIMVLMMTVAIILEASTTPLVICATSKFTSLKWFIFCSISVDKGLSYTSTNFQIQMLGKPRMTQYSSIMWKTWDISQLRGKVSFGQTSVESCLSLSVRFAKTQWLSVVQNRKLRYRYRVQKVLLWCEFSQMKKSTRTSTLSQRMSVLFQLLLKLEYFLQCFSLRTLIAFHTLKIAHSIPERRMWSKVVVRQWSHDGYHQLKQFEIPKVHEGCFYVDEQVITIYTREFSVFTCTVCEKICQITSIKLDHQYSIFFPMFFHLVYLIIQQFLLNFIIFFCRKLLNTVIYLFWQQETSLLMLKTLTQRPSV